ncbi:YcnI family protein [Amycolatopsis sp. BJA-103]|uniref:YcnI family copper-binding membrane protein n=1 Tax=unclassified Amycolatopsis TaxID=2618356 RepID=UPI000C79493F|nr:YcnI family protein [Amycolatopsis sp. BJA-103]AUI62759.1 nuclear export factor GLE1 [Amycolatopsis sp. BJA-103]PNE18599.1 nuclear export factor GLE1 [Amycolatopsis sp. BJA-103]
MSNNVYKRAGFLAATVGIAGLLSAGVASAHVTANVYGPQPAKGGYGSIFFRVPNEEKDAGTVKVEVALKPEYALSSVRTKPIPGWKAEVVKSKLPAPVTTASGTQITEAVTKVSWTAEPGTKIAAGSAEFQEFQISAGQFPTNVDALEFPATQTYENGKVVEWNQPTPASGEEPEHPAPSVKLAEKSADGHGGGGHGTDAKASEESHASSSSDTTARWLGGAGLVVGALGLGVGAGATLRARRATAGASTKSNTEGTE